MVVMTFILKYFLRSTYIARFCTDPNLKNIFDNTFDEPQGMYTESGKNRRVIKTMVNYI